MEQFMQLGNWVKEQYAETYLLTWLLTQWELWWCEGEVYAATIFQDGDRLQAFVENSQRNPIVEGVAQKLTENGTWDLLAASLNRIFEQYRQELVQLPEIRRQIEPPSPESRNGRHSATGSEDTQPEFINPYPDSLTGLND